jgi:hypothetical protein
MPWLEQPRLCSVWEHRTVRWCTGQCPVRQAGSCKLAALGISSAAYDYNSPDCPVCTGLSGEPTIGCARHVDRANSREGAPDCLVSQRSDGPTVGCAICARHVDRANSREGAPDSVRCANGSQAPTVGFATEGKKSAPDSVRCAPDCPVRQATEGKICLPRMLSTAPSCLGAIKGTPRRMEEHIKHSLSIPKH